MNVTGCEPMLTLEETILHGRESWSAIVLLGCLPMDAVIKKWPKNKGYNFRFISIQKTSKKYIAITQAGKVMGFLSNFNSQDLRKSGEILPTLRSKTK